MKRKWGKRLMYLGMSKRDCILLGILTGIILLVGVCTKNSSVDTSFVSMVNSEIGFSTNNNYIEQTWAPHVKKITDLRVPFRVEKGFKGVLEARVVSDKGDYVLANSVLKYDFVENEEGELKFSFEAFKVDIGSRYRFQIRYVEGTESGEIKIPSDNEAIGCSIDGIETGEAVNFIVTSEKNSRIFWLLSSFMPFVFVSFFMAVLSNKKMEETIGMAFVLNGVILFVFGLFEKIQVGIYFLFIFSLLCFFIAIILCLKKKIIIYSYCTPGIVAYFAIMVYVILTCHDLLRREWDEYSHWGLAVKDMFYYNSFAKHIGSSVPMMRYPPFTTLIEYFFMYNNEMFTEGILYVAYLALLFSFIVVVFKKCKWNNWGDIITTGIISILLPMVFFEHYYFIYVDLMLCVVFGYSLFCYFCEELSWFNIMRISGGLIVLVLTKDMGLVLAGLFSGAIVIAIIFKSIKNRQFRINDYIPATVFMLSALLPFVIWQIYISIPATAVTTVSMVTEASVLQELPVTEGSVLQEPTEIEEVVGKVDSTITASQISLSGMMQLLEGKAEEYKYEIISKYVNRLIVPKAWEVGYLKLSYLTILISILIGVLYFNKKLRNNKMFNFLYVCVFVSFGYAAFLLITYLFAFPYNDAIALHSHERYLSSCIGAFVTTFCNMILLEKRKTNNVECGLFTVVLSAILIVGVHLGNLYPDNLSVYITEDKIYGYDEIERLSRCFADKSESVYYVYNDSRNGALEQVIFRNYLSPLESDGGTFFASHNSLEKEKWLIEANGEADEKSTTECIKTPEQWTQELGQYDYVFIHRQGYVFEEDFWMLFDEPRMIKDKAFYEVKRYNDGIKLYYMGCVQ